MPIPPLTEHGLLPVGIHQCSLEEAQQVFAFNKKREIMWAKMLDFLIFLKDKDLAYPIFIAGGYITNKTNPEDIDIVHDMTIAHGTNQYSAFVLFSKNRDTIKQLYSVDYCINLPGQNDFSSFFQYIGPKTSALTGLQQKEKRGILSIKSTSWVDGLIK